MKKIENLQVTVTYKVGLCDLEVSDNVYEGLHEISERGGIDSFFAGCQSEENMSQAFYWLTNYISENDSYMVSYEIDDMN